MHTTATIDYGVILEGEMWLELDNGESRLVKAGDIVVQNGTRYAWRNKSDRVLRALFVMIGVLRQSDRPRAFHLSPSAPRSFMATAVYHLLGISGSLRSQ
ncbi:cupin domain-containing protein [Pseudomonas sp. NFX5]|uniref:cupin domain-containing protein n=1 Tax=Pseudomonas sp. NFX5 TaxID=2816961 RepID=UPI003BA16234